MGKFEKNFDWLKIRKMYSDENYVIFEDDESYLWRFNNNIEDFIKIRRKTINKKLMAKTNGFIDLSEKLNIEINKGSDIPAYVTTVMNEFGNRPLVFIKMLDHLNYVVVDLWNTPTPIKYSVILELDNQSISSVKECKEIK